MNTLEERGFIPYAGDGGELDFGFPKAYGSGTINKMGLYDQALLSDSCKVCAADRRFTDKVALWLMDYVTFPRGYDRYCEVIGVPPVPVLLCGSMFHTILSEDTMEHKGLVTFLENKTLPPDVAVCLNTQGGTNVYFHPDGTAYIANLTSVVRFKLARC